MITQFGIYETFNYKYPNVGDYAIVISDIGYTDIVTKFTLNNIGKVDWMSADNIFVDVKYEDIPDEIYHFFISDTHDILTLNSRHMRYAKTKEELEIYIQTNKYNL